MVVQDKNIGEVCICVNLWKLNDSFSHDPFPMPFIDEVMRVLEENKYTPSLMDYLDTIKL